jgi:hypothetical protein
VATIRAQSSEIIGSDYVKDLKVRAGELRRMVADDEGRADG